MALRSNGYIVIFSKVFLHQPHRCDFIDDSSDIDRLSLNLLDNIVIIILKILVVFLRLTVFDKIGAVLNRQLLFMLRSGLSLTVEYVGQFRLLIISLKYPSTFLLIQQTGLLFVQSTFIVVYNVQTFYHFRFVKLVA